MKDAVIMEKWKRIWSKRESNMEKLLSKDIQECFFGIKAIERQ